MGTPTAERPPRGLDANWLGVWRHALKTLQEQGSWAWEQAPLLAEYVYALREAEKARESLPALARELGVWLRDHPGDQTPVAWTTVGKIASGAPVQWDRHVKRAMALADQLALSDRGRRAAGQGAGEPEPEPDDLDLLDELAPRREARGA